MKNIAEVTLNGSVAGVAWKAPFELDITSLAKPGANRLKIKVTNLWVNRLIGDKQPSSSARITSASFDPLPATAPLMPSGLLGPVRIVQQSDVD